jgi:hypothetical protein
MDNLRVPVPAIVKPLLMPFKTVEEDGAKVRKLALLLLMQQLAPVSMQTAHSLENFSNLVFEACADCQAVG